MNNLMKTSVLTFFLTTSIHVASAQVNGTDTFKQLYDQAESIDLNEFEEFSRESVVCFASDISSVPGFPGTGVCMNATYSPIVKLSANEYTIPAGVISAAKGAKRDFKEGKPGIAAIQDGDFTFEWSSPFKQKESMVVKIRRMITSESVPTYITRKYFCNTLQVTKRCNTKEVFYGVFKTNPIDLGNYKN